MGGRQSSTATGANADQPESEAEMAVAVNKMIADNTWNDVPPIKLVRDANGSGYYLQTVGTHPPWIRAAPPFAPLTGCRLWAPSTPSTSPRNRRRQEFTLRVFARSTGASLFRIGLQHEASEFLMACIEAPPGTLDRGAVKWNMLEDLNQCAYSPDALARLSDAAIAAIYSHLPPLSDDANRCDMQSRLVTLVTMRVKARAWWSVTRHQQPRPAAVGTPQYGRTALPSKGYFEILLAQTQRDGSGVSVTAKNRSTGETPAQTMRKLSQLTAQNGGLDAKEQADDAKIAQLLEEKEKWVREYPALLKQTIDAAWAPHHDDGSLSIIIQYVLVQPREWRPEPSAAPVASPSPSSAVRCTVAVWAPA